MRVRREEYFEIHKVRRIYNRETGKFIINIEYSTAAPKPTERVISVAEAFGIGVDRGRKFTLYKNAEFIIGPTDIVYVTGDSGSGKSALLRALKRDIVEGMGLSVVDIEDIKPEHEKPIIETIGRDVNDAIHLLSLVGLNEAFLFLRPYEQLSDGQKYRYKIAKMMESQAQFWIADEFAATLDRDTAKIVAYNLQKHARRLGRGAIVATTHTDLLEDLAPSVHIHKRFGREITVKYYPNRPASECSLVREMHVCEGSIEDWRQLAHFHYRSHRLPSPRKIFSMRRGDEVCGVIVYSYPPPACFGRRLVLPKMSLRELNERLSTISRVVIHPKYRSIGLGAKLVRDTLPICGTPYVETVAVMARYNPFFEKAGMVRVAEMSGDPTIRKAVEELEAMGFERYMQTSLEANIERLNTLSREEVDRVKEIILEVSQVYYRRLIGGEKIYAGKEDVERFIEEKGLEGLAKIICRIAILAQTKIYLFWKNPSTDAGG
ncbi:MAG: ATP-binding cassette domain-containing protein [Nitrososphaerota archaeon]